MQCCRLYFTKSHPTAVGGLLKSRLSCLPRFSPAIPKPQTDTYSTRKTPTRRPPTHFSHRSRFYLRLLRPSAAHPLSCFNPCSIRVNPRLILPARFYLRFFCVLLRLKIFPVLIRVHPRLIFPPHVPISSGVIYLKSQHHEFLNYKRRNRMSTPKFPQLVMIIRHGEKPGNPATDTNGGPNLSVLGSATVSHMPSGNVSGNGREPVAIRWAGLLRQ